MKTEFNDLEESEKNAMYAIPIYVAVLIALADGQIDNVEIRKAISLAKLKTKNEHKELIEFYKVVNEDYEDKLKWIIANLPSKKSERKYYISERLSEVNGIFKKIHKSYASNLYESLKDIAVRIARASGGIFGYKSISPEEAELIKLKMIHNPVS